MVDVVCSGQGNRKMVSLRTAVVAAVVGTSCLWEVQSFLPAPVVPTSFPASSLSPSPSSPSPSSSRPFSSSGWSALGGRREPTSSYQRKDKVGRLFSTTITDEQVMEDLIACPWDKLDEFGTKHYKLLIHPQFYMKLADRIYELPTQEEQDDAAAKATKIWNTLLKMLDAAEEQRLSTASVLENIVKKAAEEDGHFYIPLTKERTQAVRSEVVKNLDRFDEGLLQTLNSWVVKVQDDPDNRDMAGVLQKVYQFYAGQALMRFKGLQRPEGEDTRSPAQIFLRCLLNGDPDEWDMLIYNGLKVDVVCSVDDLVDEVGVMIQLVITQLNEGSLTQRVQAEFLRELMARVQRYGADSSGRGAALS